MRARATIMQADEIDVVEPLSANVRVEIEGVDCPGAGLLVQRAQISQCRNPPTETLIAK